MVDEISVSFAMVEGQQRHTTMRSGTGGAIILTIFVKIFVGTIQHHPARSWLGGPSKMLSLLKGLVSCTFLVQLWMLIILTIFDPFSTRLLSAFPWLMQGVKLERFAAMPINPNLFLHDRMVGGFLRSL